MIKQCRKNREKLNLSFWTYKDIFIYDQDNLDASGAMEHFDASGLTIHKLSSASEYDNDRVVNFNGGAFAHTDQKGVRVVKENYFDENDKSNLIAGYTYSPEWPATPNTTTQIVIYTEAIKDYLDIIQDDDDAVSGAGVSDYIKYALGHELGHSVSITHHDPTNSGNDCLMKYYNIIGNRWGWYGVDYFCTSDDNCKPKIRLH